MNLREYAIMYRREDTYWWYRGMRRIARRVAPELFACGAGTRILDAGSGTGANLDHVIRSSGASGFGVDLELEALRFCRSRGLGRMVQGSVTALPFRAESFDHVMSHDVLFTVPGDEGALKEYFRVCRPGGGLYVTVAAFSWLGGEHDRATHAVRRYTRAELSAKLERAGFLVKQASYANFFLLLPIFLTRRLRSLLFSAPADEDAISDFHLSPAGVNGALTGVLYLEALLMRWFSFPVGVTLVVRALRP